MTTTRGEARPSHRSRLRHRFVPNFSAGMRLDALLASGVFALLVLRLYLYLTGFPQVGGSSVHIAHMLYGGLLMIVAVVLALAFIDRAAQWTAAILGGAGFGIFIDELGKFITRDIDYFYRPAVSTIYILFIALYLGMREIMDHERPTSAVALANALELSESVVMQRASLHDLHRLEYLLGHVDGHRDLVAALQGEIDRARRELPNGVGGSMSTRIRWQYRRLLHEGWLLAGVVLGCLAVEGAAFVVALAETAESEGVNIGTLILHLHYARTGGLVFSALALLCALLGLARLPRRRLSGLRWLRRSLQVSMLLTQVFLFYYIQFDALFFLAAQAVVMVPLTSILNRERRRAANERPVPAEEHRALAP